MDNFEDNCFLAKEDKKLNIMDDSFEFKPLTEKGSYLLEVENVN